MFEQVVQQEDLGVPEWVKKQLGKNVIERATKVGRDTVAYLEDLQIDVSLERKTHFQSYMHRTGQQILSMNLFDTSEEDRQQALRNKQVARAGRILRNHVKVSENEAGQKSVDIDREWNTGSWAAEMIEAGMDVLFSVFLDSTETEGKKNQAVVMLKKLLHRHAEAKAYIQFKLDDLMTQALNSFVRQGKTRANLDILYILHAAREKLVQQISDFSFTSRAAELLSSEMRLAAIMIQHLFRVFMSTKTKKFTSSSKCNPIAATFGTDAEMLLLRQRAAKNRTRDLKLLWIEMHQNVDRVSRMVIGGYRGPVHIPHIYVSILLDIIFTVVHKTAGQSAPMSRIAFFEGSTGGGCSAGALLLAGFISSPTGNFAYASIKILAELTKCYQSWKPCLESGCVGAVYRFLLYLRSTGKLYWMPKGRDELHRMKDASNDQKMAYQVS